MTKKVTEKVEEINVKNPEVTNPEIIPPPVEKIEVEVPTVEDLQETIDKLTLKVANKTEEAKRVHGKLEAFEKAEKEKGLDDLSEIGKLQAQLSEKDAALLEAKTSLKKMKLNEQKINIAAEVGLPAVLSLRIQGETPEEMEEDARALMEGLPKKQARIPVTLPGENASKPERSVAEQLNDLGL